MFVGLLWVDLVYVNFISFKNFNIAGYSDLFLRHALIQPKRH